MREPDSPLVVDGSSDTSSPPLLTGWFDALGKRFLTVAELALAETRLAVSTFMLMIFLSVLAAGALLIGWALLLYALAQWPIAMGISSVAVTLVLVVAHVLAAFGLWRYANALGDKMDLPETRRLMRSAAEAVEESDGHGA